MKNYVNLEELNYQNLQSIYAHRDALRLFLEMLQENEVLQLYFGDVADFLTMLLEGFLELLDRMLE